MASQRIPAFDLNKLIRSTVPQYTSGRRHKPPLRHQTLAGDWLGVELEKNWEQWLGSRLGPGLCRGAGARTRQAG
jgi:hypothetical protein